MGLGTVIILINLVMLWALHAVLPRLPARHRRQLKHFSKHPLRYRFWTVRVEAQHRGTASSP